MAMRPGRFVRRRSADGAGQGSESAASSGAGLSSLQLQAASPDLVCCDVDDFIFRHPPSAAENRAVDRGERLAASGAGGTVFEPVGWRSTLMMPESRPAWNRLAGEESGSDPFRWEYHVAGGETLPAVDGVSHFVVRPNHVFLKRSSLLAIRPIYFERQRPADARRRLAHQTRRPVRNPEAAAGAFAESDEMKWSWGIPGDQNLRFAIGQRQQK